MVDTCEILAGTQTQDSGGGISGGASVSATTVCAVRDVVGGPEQAVADRLGWSVAYAVRLPAATVVTPANTLRINSARVFNIGAILDRGTQATAKIAVCQETNP